MTFAERRPDKSPAEIEMDAAMDEYAQRFGKPFVVDFAGEPRTMEETTAEIRRLIAAGKEQDASEYIRGAVY